MVQQILHAYAKRTYILHCLWYIYMHIYISACCWKICKSSSILLSDWKLCGLFTGKFVIKIIIIKILKKSPVGISLGADETGIEYQAYNLTVKGHLCSQ